MSPRVRLLVVDDKPTFLSLFEKIVDGRMDVRTAQSAEKALGLLSLETFDVVVTDVRMPGMDGVALLREIKARSPHVEVIVVTGFGTIPQAVEAMRLGAFSYLTKPFDPDEAWSAICAAANRSAEASREASTRESPRAEPVKLAGLTYREAIDAARDQVTRDYLVELLRSARGNVTRAAQRAGVERESFHRLLRRFQLRAEDFRGKA